MVKALFDTNVLIDDLLCGIPAAEAELARYDDTAISVIAWMEMLAAAPPTPAQPTRDFFDFPTGRTLGRGRGAAFRIKPAT